jgi:hypothetical protein
VVKCPDVDGRGTQHDLILDSVCPPPNDFGPIVGNAIHNFRSVLDHLAFQLAMRGATAVSATVTEKEATRIQFPIVFSKPFRCVRCA